MSEQAFGGDDDSTGTPEQAPKPKKPDLKKFVLLPDSNVRDIFWRIMGSYATTSEISKEFISGIVHHNTSLVRISISELARDEKSYHGISKNFIAIYTIMFIFDAGWFELFPKFIVSSFEARNKPLKSVVTALIRLLTNEKYKQFIVDNFISLIRDVNNSRAALSYIVSSKSIALIRAVKRELMIIARNDIEENQQSAIIALSELSKEEPDIKNNILYLLNHWDSQTRKLIVYILRNEKDEHVLNSLRRQLELETDQEIKKSIEKILGINRKTASIKITQKSGNLKKEVEKLKNSLRKVKKLKYQS